MNVARPAVFLSYASQDAAAVARICDALRAAGVEVWFDQNELTGGDAWDQKIRKQIKECALFVPVISASTQARREGYFRLEWKIAAQRTHTMADGTPFLLPVVIDDTRDSAALVPEEFRAVQWTRLPGGATPVGFAARVQQLLSADLAPTERPSVSRPHAVGRPGRRFPLAGWIGAVLALAVVAWLGWSQFGRRTATAAVGGGDEVARLRAGLRPDQWTRADFNAFVPVIERVLQAHPDNGDAWALRSIADSLLVIRNLDTGTKPLVGGKEAADRALRLAPQSPLGQLALGLHFVANISRGGDPLAPRAAIDRALAALPPEPLTRYAELGSYWLGYQFEGADRSADAWLAAEPRASFPAWIRAQAGVVRRRPDEAARWANQAAQDADITGVRSLVTLFEARYYLQADLAAARAALDRVPTGQRGVHRVLASRVLLALAEGQPDLALQELARAPEAMLLDRVYHGPKAFLAGLAHLTAGRGPAAQPQFAESERLLRQELTGDPENLELRALLALNLVYLERRDEARRELSSVEPLLAGWSPSVYSGQIVALVAQTRGILGDFEQMGTWLRRLLAGPSPLPFTPSSLRLDVRFKSFVDQPVVGSLLREFVSLDGKAPGPSAEVPEKSVAVLAFANLSDDKANEYFSDGLSEELLNVLAKVPGLKVSARTSAFHFKGKDTPIAEIARQLGVAYVVEGSVRKAGSQVRITAQLIKAADSFHVWSETFTRDVKDVFAVHDEVAGLIAKSLQLQLGARSAPRTVNPEAYELQLKAQAILNRGAPPEYGNAISLLKESLAIDGNSAPAWAWLASGYMLAFAQNAPGLPLEREALVPVARAAANRAVEVDPQGALGHFARALIAFLADWEWAEAESSIQRGLALAPGDAGPMSLAASIALTLGQTERGLELSRRASALDPLNFPPTYQFLKALWHSGKYREMQETAERMIVVLPTSYYGPLFLSYAHLLQGRAEAAAESAERITGPGYRLTALALARHAQGKAAEAAAALEELKSGFGKTSAYQVAENYAFRNDRDRAFEWLEISYRERDAGLTLITNDPFLKNLRGDPRWAAFMRKLKLPDGTTK